MVDATESEKKWALAGLTDGWAVLQEAGITDIALITDQSLAERYALAIICGFQNARYNDENNIEGCGL